MASDSQIACALYKGAIITPFQFSVWCRQEEGETIFSMRNDYLNPTTGRLYSPETLYEWVRKVNQSIDESRMITTDTRPVEDPDPWGITVAVGHLCHEAADDTPQPHKKPRSRFPDHERLKMSGKRPRY